MGAAASLVSNDRRDAVRIAVHEVFPLNLYPLEERLFSKGSFYADDDDTRFADQRAHIPVFETLGLHEWSVSQLWRHFRQMSVAGGSGVTLWEFREYFDLPDDRSTSRLFRCFDEDRDNRIGFLELVVGLWTYCCNCNAALICLSFDLYDTDHNGQISLNEADFMIEDVFGPEWESNDLGRATHEWVHGREAAVLGAPELGIDDWSTFMSANQLVMAEAIRKRLILQKKMIGVDFWSHCITKRVTIYAGRRVTVEQLLGAHISQEVLDLLANDRNPSTDHNDTTQFTLKVLRRTGPFPRRRKFRELKAKKIAFKAKDKFKYLTVRQTFERLTVRAGEDAGWEEPKAPSALQILMASLQKSGITDRGGAAAVTAANDSRATEKKMKETIAKLSKSPSSSRIASTEGAASRPEALALLTVRPGLDDTPLGSSGRLAETKGNGDGEINDPILANAFHGLKPLPSAPVTATTKDKSRGKSKQQRGLSKNGGGGGGTGKGSPIAAGGGKEALSRTGKELLGAGELRAVGVGGVGDGVGGEGGLSARLLVGTQTRGGDRGIGR